MRVICLAVLFYLMACNTSANHTNAIDQSSTEKVTFLKSDKVELSKPVLSIDSIIFINSAKLEFDFGMPEAEILYNINHGPWLRFGHPVTITENAIVNYKTQKDGFDESIVSQIQLVQANKLLSDVELTLYPQPNEKYPGDGATSLNDLKKGSLNFKSGNAWIGFQDDSVEIDFEWNNEQAINKIMVSILEDHSSWIFSPSKIKVYTGKELIAEKKVDIPTKMSSANLVFLTLDLDSASTKKIKVVIDNMNKIPAWHPGSGLEPWLFIDEIIVE